MNIKEVNIPDNLDFNTIEEEAIVSPKAEKNNEVKLIMNLAEQIRIKPDEDLPPPPVVMAVNEDENKEAIIGTLGNFSLVIGKAKSRKTFFISVELAAAFNGKKTVLGKFKGSLPSDKSKVLFFDTEQGRYHVLKAYNRILKLSGNQDVDNFNVYPLRNLSPLERLKMIETVLYNTSGIGFVVIDGIRDLVTSINDEEQATAITSKLLKWTEELQIHIVTVLHQNKGDNNARGHLGSEMTNKAETVLSITKSDEDKEISIVQAEYCRDKEPEPFAFCINDLGLPEIVEDYEFRAKKNKAKLTPDEVPDIKLYEVLNQIFGTADANDLEGYKYS